MGEERKPNIKKSNLAERLTTYIFYASVFIFLVAFNFRDSMTGGWYQQWLPNTNGSSITDVTFKDSLNGFSVTNVTGGNGYILKTTNGGDNWIINYTYPYSFYRIQFINNNSGYILGLNQLFKTTNSGINWTILTLPDLYPHDIFVLNMDTLWAVSNESMAGGVFRTTNGGTSWTQQFSGGTENPNNIYMYNARIGFICNNANNSGIKKTNNGGLNWFEVLPNEGFRDMYFIDSLIGWKSTGFPDSSMKKTTDGGLNWVKQSLPHGGYISNLGGILRFSNINKDTIWGVGNYIIYPNNSVHPILYRTTNGGANWSYQIPDTSIIHLVQSYYFIKFINKIFGWGYNFNNGIHTVVGGDTTFLSSVRQISNEVPKEFELYQNYPNPFNPSTYIGYYIQKQGWVKLKIYDIAGKEMGTLVNEIQSIGGYGVPVTLQLSSGVYFYKLIFTTKSGIQVDTKKMLMIK